VIGVVTFIPTLHEFRLSVLNNPPQGALFSVNGRNMHMYCVGEGTPTVLFEHGYSGSSLDWSYIQPQVSNITRTCSYDRAGYGWSDIGPEPRHVANIAQELKILLQVANIHDDIVLVGHSCESVEI
jgi:pimeloyl-ACP methyl ester carboxylesterase